MITQQYIDRITYQVIGCAIGVHKELGPGLLERVYKRCLIEEFIRKGLQYMRQVAVPVVYKGSVPDAELRIDLLVENLMVVELKSVELMHPVFEAQLLTYMKLLKKPKGVLINFNCTNIFKEGQKTLVNEYYAQLPKL